MHYRHNWVCTPLYDTIMKIHDIMGILQSIYYCTTLLRCILRYERDLPYKPL